MITDLKNYYKKQGILSTSFTCPHRNECSAGCTSFTGPKSAFISEGYERGDLPRLLFLSLDSGRGDAEDKNRLPHAVRQQEAGRDVLSLPKHKHWYRTHELAWYILRRFMPELKLEEAKSYFSHANSAKCCMNKPQKAKADKVLFKNCQKYLAHELSILKPEIIVTQGAEAKAAVSVLSDGVHGVIDEFAAIISLAGRRVFWLHTYHPNCWGAFNKHRSFNKATKIADGWEFYADEIFGYFLSEEVPKA